MLTHSAVVAAGEVEETRQAQRELVMGGWVVPELAETLQQEVTEALARAGRISRVVQGFTPIQIQVDGVAVVPFFLLRREGFRSQARPTAETARQPFLEA